MSNNVNTPTRTRSFQEACERIIDLTGDEEDEEVIHDKRDKLASLATNNIFAHMYDATTSVTTIENEQRQRKRSRKLQKVNPKKYFG
jgi:hypothetical protein